MQTLVTCGAIIMNESGNVLIVRRTETDPHRPLQWDLPGGHVEPGELFEAGLVREVREETAIDLEQAQPQLMYASTYPFDEVSVTWLFFTVKVQGAEVTLSAEHDQYKWVSPAEAIAAVEYERKRDALVYARDHNLLS